MIKSMTGYGKGEATVENGKFVVEIRSVNHRYGEISIRMPRQFQGFEIEVKRRISSVLKRGKIDVSIQWEDAISTSGIPQVQNHIAVGYFKAFSDLATELGIAEPIPLSLILSQKGVLQDCGAEYNHDELLPVLLEAVNASVNSIDLMRRREGESLLLDLTMRKQEIEKSVLSISEAVPGMVADYRTKLASRLEALVCDTKLDMDRLAQEVAIMADRCDITEETVRLSSHFKQWDFALSQNEPIGRKLDFLMQEMNREVNTIGSKAADSTITTLVIQIKAEMEKMREQIQNIE